MAGSVVRFGRPYPERRLGVKSELAFHRELRALGKRLQLGPGDLGMAAAAETAIGAGHHILRPHQFGEAADPLRHQFRVLDAVGRVRNHAGNEDLALRQLHVLPDRIFVLVPCIRRLDQIALRPYPQHQVDQLVEFDVEGVGAVPAAPAQMIADAVLRQAAERMIERLDPYLAVFAKGGETHVDADAIPQRRQPGVIDLQDETGGDDCLIFAAHRFGEGKDEFFLAWVILIATVGLQACRRRGGDEGFRVPPDHAAENIDLASEARLTAIADRPGCNPMRARLFDLPGGFVEQGSALGCGAVEVRENLAVLPLQDDRLAARRWTRLEAAETIVNVREPVAALCVFAFIDHIDADLALTRNDVGNHLAQIGVVFTAWPGGAVWARQAADMGRENLFARASLHRPACHNLRQPGGCAPHHAQERRTPGPRSPPTLPGGARPNIAEQSVTALGANASGAMSTRAPPVQSGW